jgi:hypothetical protein
MWAFLLFACHFSDDTTGVSVVGTTDGPPDTIDTGPSGEGDLAITLHFSRYEGVVGCAAAGIEEVSFTFGESAITLPCDDSAIPWLGVPAIDSMLQIRADTSYGPFYAASVGVTVPEDGEVPVDVTLDCDDNGWDDGCGGG